MVLLPACLCECSCTNTNTTTIITQQGPSGSVWGHFFLCLCAANQYTCSMGCRSSSSRGVGGWLLHFSPPSSTTAPLTIILSHNWAFFPQQFSSPHNHRWNSLFAIKHNGTTSTGQGKTGNNSNTITKLIAVPGGDTGTRRRHSWQVQEERPNRRWWRQWRFAMMMNAELYCRT